MSSAEISQWMAWFQLESEQQNPEVHAPNRRFDPDALMGVL